MGIGSRAVGANGWREGPGARPIAGLVVGLGLTMLIAACASDNAGRVFFVEPSDGAVVASPVLVGMGVEGFTIEPATEGVGDGRGHFHIIVDHPCVQPRLTVRADDQHLHFGGGQMTALLDLAPGEHTLCLQVANGVHTALDLTDEITITVE